VGNEKANMSIVHQFTFNPFQENTFVIYDETKEGIIIDPGCYTNEEKQQLQSFIADNKISIKYLINTHCHIDHVLGNVFVKEKFGVGLYIHKEDESTLRSVGTYAQVYGFPQFDSSRADNYLKEGDTVSFGNSALEVIFAPGHAPGHICLVNKKDKYIIGGDVLFYGSIGRTDLPGGDHATLIKSIRVKIFNLDDDFRVYTGHGPATNIGFEKINNPFFGLNA
jgi:hydroxyacylglutathione hydrolase